MTKSGPQNTGRTANAGRDFTAAAGDLYFAPGETAKTVEVALLDLLGMATEGASVGDPGSAAGALPRGDDRVEGLRRGGRHPVERIDARVIMAGGVKL